jgi:hypothetical protein
MGFAFQFSSSAYSPFGFVHIAGKAAMARRITLWVVALLITLGSAYWQRRSGPTYPVSGSVDFAGTTVEYHLDRSHSIASDQEVVFIAPNSRIRGRVLYRRVHSADEWTAVPLLREGDRLLCTLPKQPPAGKLEYSAELNFGEERLLLPLDGKAVVTRFKGDVPDWVLIPHVIFMFLAMLFSTRAGLEACFRDGKSRRLAVWTISLLFIGGLLLGPLVQKFAFGEYWTGIPYGTDLTDNKTLIAFIAWAVACVAVWNRNIRISHPGRRWFVVFASVVMMAVFVVPHSMWGSELKYDAPADNVSAPVSMKDASPVEAHCLPAIPRT